MNRVTITLDDDLLGEIDAFVTERGYQNRSEVIRDLAREGLAQKREKDSAGKQCVGALGLCLRPRGKKSVSPPGRKRACAS